ncbi:MAG: repressor [Inoviridae sp.]|nr:MAG: repressor [Inoviridae sp.]
MQPLLQYRFKSGERIMKTKTYRIKVIYEEPIKNKKWEIIKEIEQDISENDIINTLCHKHLEEIKAEDIIKYRCEVLGKCKD